MLSPDEVDALRTRWQLVFARLPVPDDALDVERSLFIVNVDTPHPVPVGGVRFKRHASALDTCFAYASALAAAGFDVAQESLPSPDDVRAEGAWYECKFGGFEVPWTFGIKVESYGCRMTVGPDAIDAPGAPPIGEPPALQPEP